MKKDGRMVKFNLGRLVGKMELKKGKIAELSRAFDEAVPRWR